MIKIKTKKTKYKSDFDFINELAEKSFNVALESTKQELENVFKDYKCDNHKEKSKGIILLSYNQSKSKSLSFDLSDFCCQDFKETVSKSLKK